MSAARPGRILRTTLENGLRVVLAPDDCGPRIAASVHYGVGYRSEPPGKAGFAHLFEHLMFRGSESLPDGRFYDHILRCGGEANGTTHQDYTDYYQAVPSGYLEQALFSEADRMRAPRFTAENLAQQLEGVEKEVREATRERPYGGLPWPLLPGLLYRNFANAHDGYGDVDALKEITLDDCAWFFDTYYTPGNAVLTVAGDFSPEHASELIERHFGDIPARPAGPAVELEESPPTADSLLNCAEPGVNRTALAVGYRLPDPGHDLGAYLAHAVLAMALTESGLRPAGGIPALPMTTSCGFFGMLDARDPDTLVLTSMLPHEVSPSDALRALDDALDRLASPDDTARQASWARRRLTIDHGRAHSDLQSRCRGLGRMELLFGRAELLDEVPDHLAAVTTDAVAHAARTLRGGHRAVLVMVPGPQRTRPRTVPPAQDDRSGAAGQPYRDATVLARTSRGPRAVPGIRCDAAPRYAGIRDQVVGDGLRVIAVADARTPAVEFRLHAPRVASLPPHITHLDAFATLAAAHTGAVRRMRDLGGDCGLGSDGQNLTVRGHVPPDGVAGWLAILTDLFTVTGATTGLDGEAGEAALLRARRVMAGSPDRLFTEALRARYRGAWHADSSEALATARLAPDGAVLIAVGALDPEDLIAQVRAHVEWPGPVRSSRSRPAPPIGEERFSLPAPGIPATQIKLCAPEPPGDPGDPARYLASAAVGLSLNKRVAHRFAGYGGPECELVAVRDTFFGHPQVCLVGGAPPELVDALLDTVHEEFGRLRREKFAEDELGPVREFRAGQVLMVFDSPAALADQLLSGVAVGRDPTWLVRLPRLLRDVDASRVTEAARELFGGPFTTVLLGGVEELAASR
ncbi:M16 family metallopeptidase [Streptosporangium sp. NPDC000396]|uniref:M16 family metallopeptidase n=1 Tax=Streptosporangium sp. NPDC000396 TaxID=3366185 RepID=UPI0036D0D45F